MHRPDRADRGGDHRSLAGDRTTTVTALLRLSAHVATVELRRGLRWLRDQDYIALGVALVTLTTLPGLWVLYRVSRGFGSSLSPATPVPTTVQTAIAGAWLFLTALFVVSGLGSNGDLGDYTELLAIRPAGHLAPGLFLAELVKYVPFVFGPILVGYLGLSAGVGDASPILGGMALGVVALSSAAAVGYPVGIVLKGVIRRSERLARLKPVLAVLVGVAYLTAIITGQVGTVVRGLEPALLGSPLGWLGDLALVTTRPVDASVGRALAVVGLAALSVGLGVLGTVRASTFAWYTDRTQSVEEDSNEAADSDAATESTRTLLSSVLSPVCRRPETLGVASVTLARMYRAPMQLVFAAIPLVAAISLFDQLLTRGTLPWYTPWAVLGIGSWMAGTTVALNPLGLTGRVLPTLLTSRATGRQVIRGTVVAAVTPLILPVALLSVAAGLVAETSAVAVGVIGVATPVVLVASAVVAAAIGVTSPRFRSIDVTDGLTIVPPNRIALTAFSLVVSLGSTAAALAVDSTARVVAAVLLERYLSVELSPDTLETVALVVVVAILALIPVSYVYASRRVGTFTLD